MRIRSCLFGLAILPVFGVPSVNADTLLIDRSRQEQAALPERGKSMAYVEARFGTPVRKHPAVGGDGPRQPPITRWEYPNFVVYFEHDHVVDAVQIKAHPNEIGPAPAQR